MSADLTLSEAERLDACEQVIERGLATFVDVGAALLEVRDSRLYRMAYPTFEAYCAERWNMTRPRAYQLIDAAGVVNGLSTIGIQALPANERTARELSGLPPDERREVWQAAVATAPGGKVTAAHVRAVARISEALSAAPEPVREVVERFGVADADTISELTRLHRNKAETFAEVAASGWIQPGDEEAAVRIDAGALKVREALRDKAQAHRLLAADERAARLTEQARAGLRCELYHCDLVDAPVDAESVDAILTDPPYGVAHRALYGDLADVAARVLKPGGSLVVMSGQADLPFVLQALTAGPLQYQWTFAYLTPGGQSAQLWVQRVNTFWKPLIWLTKGAYSGRWKGDVLKSAVNDNDKALHKWQQSLSGMRDIVARFTEPDDVVFDPFMGSGTTGAVSLEAARHFIGCDNDAAAVSAARERMVGHAEAV